MSRSAEREREGTDGVLRPIYGRDGAAHRCPTSLFLSLSLSLSLCVSLSLARALSWSHFAVGFMLTCANSDDS